MTQRPVVPLNILDNHAKTFELFKSVEEYALRTENISFDELQCLYYISVKHDDNGVKLCTVVNSS